MSKEVELKFLILLDHDLSAEECGDRICEKITQLLKHNKLGFEHHVNLLKNCYFDTADQTLRAMDMGLRIRRDAEHIEQTIKTAGELIGGLHQRPEYNVSLADNFPDLSLFPSNIWPDLHLVQQIQPRLQALFTTDFNRAQWRVSFQSSLIDIVFDQGEISAHGRSEPICEIELEIVSGEVTDLMGLASLLFSVLKLPNTS